jgi:hypothetical protein
MMMHSSLPNAAVHDVRPAQCRQAAARLYSTIRHPMRILEIYPKKAWLQTTRGGISTASFE